MEALHDADGITESRAVWLFICGESTYIKSVFEDVGVKAIVLTPVFSLCRRACARLHLLFICALRAGPVCTVSWHIFTAALSCEPC